MKILFLTYHGFEDASGISKKMLAQVKGLRQNGHEVHVCYYDVTEEGRHVRFVDGEVIKDYGKSRWASLYQRISMGCVSDYCRQHGIELVYVRSFMNASPFNIRLFRQLRRDGVRSVMEIPTYPYDQEFTSLPLKYRFEHFFDQLFRRELASCMDAIVTFSDAEEIFGQRTIRISNGVDFDSLPLHQPPQQTGVGQSPLHVIAVAEVHPWHAFDRFIAGMGEYYQQAQYNRSAFRDVFLHVVGGVPDSIMYGDSQHPGFMTFIQQYHIERQVIFHGKLFGEALDQVFNQCSFAVGSLGRHRTGISSIKTLKNREYACRGIPFIYSECDSDFDHQPYVLKAPADESPVNLHEVLSFVDSHHFQPEAIRRTVEHLSWKVQMQQVIEQI